MKSIKYGFTSSLVISHFTCITGWVRQLAYEPTTHGPCMFGTHDSITSENGRAGQREEPQGIMYFDETPKYTRTSMK